MPVFFQHPVSESTRLGIWKIEETEEFFKGNVPQHRDVTHPHKRLQHLAGRFLLQFLFPDFPYELIRIADTRKPYLPGEQYHFSISHSGDYAAAIVSRDSRVGIDIEIPVEKITRIAGKFLWEGEREMLSGQPATGNKQQAIGNGSFKDEKSFPDEMVAGPRTPDSRLLTLLWSAKEAVFKWYGSGAVDFRQHIHLLRKHEGNETIDCYFTKTGTNLSVHYRELDGLVLAWVVGS